MSADRYDNFVFSPAEVAEDVDLPLELKREILFLHAHLGAVRPLAGAGAALELLRRRRAGRLRGEGEALPSRPACRTEARLRTCPRIERSSARSPSRGTSCATRRLARRIREEDGAARARSRGMRRAGTTTRRGPGAPRRLARGNPMMARVRRVQELFERGKGGHGRRQVRAGRQRLPDGGGDRPAHRETRWRADQAGAAAERSRARHVRECAGSRGRRQPAARARDPDGSVELGPSNPRYATSGVAGGAAGSARWSQARSLAEQAVRAAPRDARALESLGAVVHASGDSKQERPAHR